MTKTTTGLQTSQKLVRGMRLPGFGANVAKVTREPLFVSVILDNGRLLQLPYNRVVWVEK